MSCRQRFYIFLLDGNFFVWQVFHLTVDQHELGFVNQRGRR